MSREVKYRPDIDGLRAVAVGSVVLYHAGVPFFGGGYVGVDVFFVISGYLITTIIAREATEGRFTVANFYVRRIRRIFPALFAMLALVAVVASVLLMPADYAEFAQSVAATALFASNLFFWVKSGYFDAAAEIKPLLHTWSLAVEEQYYLVFPLLMAFLIGRVKAWRNVIAAIALASFALALWQVWQSTTAAFYSPFSRAWELLIGALVAVGFAPPLRARALREGAAAAGAAMVVAAVLLFKPSTPFPGLAALLPCAGAALLIHADAEHPTATGRLLSARPMVGLGLVSYSLYLWHWPVLVFWRYVVMRPLGLWEMVAAVGVGLLLAIQSWRWVERPFRHGPTLRPRLFLTAGIVMSVAVAFGVTGWASHGLPQRLPPEARRLAAAADDVNPDRARCDRPSATRIAAGTVCVLGDPSAPAPTFALMGDSFGDAFMPAVVASARDHHAKGLMLTHSGCLPLARLREGAPDCQRVYAAAVKAIRAAPSVGTVILVGRWTTAITGERFGAWPQTIPLTDALSPPGPDIRLNAQVIDRALAETVRDLAPRRVFVVAGLPEQPLDPPRAAALRAWLRPPRDFGVSRTVYDRRQSPVWALLGPQSQALAYTVLDVAPWLCDARTCPAVRGGAVLYADDNHVSRTGALAAKNALAPAFAPTAPPPRSRPRP